MLKQFDYEKMPVVEVVNEMMIDSSKRGASDIHFDPLADYMKVRIRIDGALVDYSAIPNVIKKNLITRIKIIAGMNITESRLPQDGAIKTTIQDMNLDLRVSSIPTSEGEKIVIRILDYSMSIAGIEHLGFSEANYKKILQMISVPNGILLVTGATGSGKSTTVYSILQRLNKEETNIITVEDPIEMDIEGINQIQTNSEIGLDFATALRSILRQDPNVIMIGEIRDTETAKIAVRASITGHIVLSTLHTNDALNTIERLLDMDVERYLLSSALTGIVSQKLARRLCDRCKTVRPVNDYEKKLVQKVLNTEINEIYTAVGCEHCSSGYKGRIALHEVLMINQDIRNALSTGESRERIRELVYSSDVITMLQDGLQKVLNGYTTFEEVLKLIELDSDDFEGAADLRDSIAQSDSSHLSAESEKILKPLVEEQTIAPSPHAFTADLTQLVSQVKEVENQNSQTIQPQGYSMPIDNMAINQPINNIQLNTMQPENIMNNNINQAPATIIEPQTTTNPNQDYFDKIRESYNIDN